MKKRNKIIIATIGGIVLIGSLAACGPRHSPEEMADYVVDKVSDKLELTAPQISQLEQLKDEVMKARSSMKAERGSVHDEINALLSQPAIDQQRALQLVQDKTESVRQKAPPIITAFANFYDSLDAEQQSMIREKFQEHKERRHGWNH